MGGIDPYDAFSHASMASVRETDTERVELGIRIGVVE